MLVVNILIVHDSGLDTPGAVLPLQHVCEVGEELPEGKCRDSKPQIPALPGTRCLPCCLGSPCNMTWLLFRTPLTPLSLTWRSRQQTGEGSLPLLAVVSGGTRTLGGI